MPLPLRAGWELNDQSISATQFKATIPATVVSGSDKGTQAKLAVVNNIQSGSFDLYTPTGFGFGNPIARYDPTQDKLIPLNKASYDTFFNPSTAEGKNQLSKIVGSVKFATYDMAQIVTGTDPTLNANFIKLQKLNGYKSLANQAIPGQRLPPQSTPDGTASITSDIEIINTGTPSTLNIETQIKTGDVSTVLGITDKLIVYPKNLGTTKQDFIQFDMMNYATRDFRVGLTSTSTADFSMGSRDIKERLCSVYLPIQPSISDQNDVSWGEDRMTPFQAIGANVAASGSTDEAMREVDQLEQISSNKGYQQLLRKVIGGMAVGVNVISRTDGLVLNPNLELLFSGPSLRPFNFTFRLSPRDQDEATNVKKIIKFFKFGSAVRTTVDGLFLKAPYVFNISYKFKNTDKEATEHPGLNRIKTCALRTVSVNYTPDGSYMTFGDGTMTSYEISLQFCELEPVYDKDYKNNPGLIGY